MQDNLSFYGSKAGSAGYSGFMAYGLHMNVDGSPLSDVWVDHICFRLAHTSAAVARALARRAHTAHAPTCPGDAVFASDLPTPSHEHGLRPPVIPVVPRTPDASRRGTRRVEFRPDPEIVLILLCARPRACAPDTAALSSAAAGVEDWDRFLDLCRRHRLVPLVDQMNRERAFLPEPVATRMAEIAKSNAIRALRYSAALLQIIAALEGAGVPAVALKGPILATQAYGEPVLRSFADLDVLVREQQIRAAIGSLRPLGYQATLPGDETGRHSLRARQHAVLDHRKTGVTLDVHWRLAQVRAAFRMRTEDAFARAVPVKLLERDVLSLSPADQFVYLAAHAAIHGWNELEDFRCLGEVVTRHPEIDWAACMEQAQSIGAGRRLRIAVQILDGLGVRWEREVMHEAAADDQATELSHVARSTWGTMQAAEPAALRPARLVMRSLDSRRARARYAAGMVFEADEADQAAFHIPRLFDPLYFVLRPARMLARSLGRASRRLV